jgi:hypothetical protein
MANVRSPNYPAVSLPEAIKRIAMVYKQEQRHPAEKEVIAKHIGYGSLNGGSNAVISALTKYGLLVPTGKGDQLKLSEEALNIVIHDRGEPDRVKAIQKAAFTPSPFNELNGLYGTNLPSDHSLRATLLKKGFNEKTVDSVIRAFRDTIEFVNMETEGSNMESVDEPQETLMQTQTNKQVFPSMIRSDLPTYSTLETNSNETVWHFGLAADCQVHTIFIGHLTQEALQTFKKFIDLQIEAGAVPSASSKQATSEPETDPQIEALNPV